MVLISTTVYANLSLFIKAIYVIFQQSTIREKGNAQIQCVFFESTILSPVDLYVQYSSRIGLWENTGVCFSCSSICSFGPIGLPLPDTWREEYSGEEEDCLRFTAHASYQNTIGRKRGLMQLLRCSFVFYGFYLKYILRSYGRKEYAKNILATGCNLFFIVFPFSPSDLLVSFGSGRYINQNNAQK